jgi:hypothetical protein
VKRNLVVSTCTFCQLPTVKNLPDEALQVKSPDDLLRDEHEKALKAIDQQAERDVLKDTIWKAALAGLTNVEACQHLKMDLQTLTGIVEGHFNVDWFGLLELARITVRVDLANAAIKGARNGDSRLLLRLMDDGVFGAATNGAGVLGETNPYRHMSLEQLREKRAALTGVVDRPTVLASPTVEIVDATPQDKEAFEKGETSQATRDIATAFPEPKKKAPELTPDEQLAIEAAEALQEVL